MSAPKGRRTRRIRAIIAAMRQARAQPCMRCGQRIDYDAEPSDPNSFNAGHIKAWALHPELREDPANYQQEHALCNKSAGTKDGNAGNGIGLASRKW